MTQEPESKSSDPAATDAPPVAQTEAASPRRHRFLIGAVFTLATLVGVFAVLAVWVNRQVLNTDNWAKTSSQLLADKRIQSSIAAYSVNQLFDSGVPQAQIKNALSALPKPLQSLDGPLDAGLRQVAAQAAPRVLASSQVQTAWRQANRAAHATLLTIINGDGRLASTNGGVVALNLRPIVDQLASALGVESQVAAARSALQANAGTVNSAAGKLGVTLPSNGRLVILRSNQLKTLQNVAGGIKGLAIVLPILAFALFILGVWLSVGHRQQALRLTGWCFVGIGLLALIARRFLGNDVVDGLIRNPANRPAGHDAWMIATTLLYDIGAALVAYGLVFVVCAWLAGRTRPAVALRRALAPTLRTRPALYYVGVYIALLLLILWGPTPATRQFAYIIGFIVLLAIGVTALRRKAAAEFPDAQAGDPLGMIPVGATVGAATMPNPVRPNGGHVGELERLAQLHDRGALTDSEFATEKAALSNGS